MNCINHPDVAAAAYCQNCGKPLCPGCVRSVGGVVFCEPCLAARLSPPPAGSTLPEPGLAGWHAHPALAAVLGFIPGVGAMYNGQFVKALAHVLIFGVFVSLSDKSVIFALLVAAWTFYQVFDAAQTAKARRDGTPLPNPFGLNDLGARLGMSPPPPYVAGFSPPGGNAAAPGPAAVVDPNPPPPAYTTPPGGAVPGTPSPGAPLSGVPAYRVPASGQPRGRREPVGAIVLIVIGILLLLQTMGVFEDEWISRSWPLIIVGLGAWLLYRRTRDTPGGGSQ